MPLAWADRCVVCLPNAELSASTNDLGVVAIAGTFRAFIAVLRWNDPVPEQISSAKCPKWGHRVG